MGHIIHPPEVEVKPLSPKEVEETAGENIPAIVIEAVNGLLKKHYRNGLARFTQGEVIDEVKNIDPTITKHSLFNNHWLDFEPLFQRVGWKVEFDKPGYNEAYEANWTFTKK
jgi:hypothetical protein